MLWGLVPRLLHGLGAERVPPGERRTAGSLVQGPVFSDGRGRQRDPTCVPVDIVQPVEVLTVLQTARPLSRQDRGQIEDGDPFRPKRAFGLAQIPSAPFVKPASAISWSVRRGSYG